MYYAPHKLYRRKGGSERDAFGRLTGQKSYTWEYVCDCRCDSNSDQFVDSDNGMTYLPEYKVVLDGQRDIEDGEYVKCVFKSDESKVRGEGVVKNRNRLNYLQYTEIWLKSTKKTT